MTSSQKNKIISIGVDVGSVNGAISVVSENGKILLLTKAPYYQTEIKSKRNKSKLNKETGKYEADFRKRNWVDFKKLREIFEPFLKYNNIYTIERIMNRAQEGATAGFVNGNALGIFQGLYTLLEPKAYYEPTPTEWKKVMGLGSIKSNSITLAEEIYGVDLRDYLSKGKVDDIAEALLLSFYGFKKYYNKEKGK